MRYEVAIQDRQLKLKRVDMRASKADAIKLARAMTIEADVAWVHVFSMATGDAVFSMQAA